MKQSFFNRRTVRVAAFLFAVILLCASFFSCDVNRTGDVETVSFTDALGREVSVIKHPERVAALLGSFADVWCLAGGELCASTADAVEDFSIELDSSSIIGGAHSPSLELLLASDPTLVLASASTASHVEMKDALESAGIAVIYFDVDNFEDYLNMLDVCTRITGRRDLYEKNGLSVKAAIDEIKSRYKEGLVPEEERRVLLLRASSSTVKAKGSYGTILGEMLADMGCYNIADGDEGLLENLSVEAVMRDEPYHIFAVTMGGDSAVAAESLEKMMMENPAWASLEAVREGRFYVMDKTLFNLKPNARWAEAYERLYEILTEDEE